MRYGFFDDNRREYVITRPDTPLPWINYLGIEDYIALISNTAGGYSFYKDARLRRITRYRYNNVPLDTSGRYIYFRSNEDGDYWSPSWQPTRRDLEDYQCRHGLGYTIISSRYRGIEVTVRYFVPMKENLEIWDVEVKNGQNVPVDLSLFSCVEFCLWDAQGDANNFQRNLSIGQVEIENGVIYHKTEYRERRNHFAFFACSEGIEGFDTCREAFLGPYRSWRNPVVVEEGVSSNSIAHGWAPIGSHHICFHLDPDETTHILFLLGYHENPQEQKFDPPGSQTINKRTVQPIIDKYLELVNVDATFNELQTYWDGLLNIFQVDTPDEHTNRMINIWNAYQNMATFNLSRSASFFESGISRGIGFRDSNQDLLGFVHMVPDRARERILDLAATQLPTGGVYHQYQPLTKRGNDEIGSNFNDDPLWLVLSVAAYLEETGDWNILDVPVEYDNQPGSETPLFEHLQRCLRYTMDRLGPHNLPLIGRADWNDCLNLNCFSKNPGESFQTVTNKDGNVAESVLIAAMFVLAAKKLSAIADHCGLNEEAHRYLNQASEMEQAVLNHGWDGEWFLRAYDDFGSKVGSHECQEGKIFIEPQGFCVMAGIGIDDGRAEKALKSVAEHLATPHGIILQQPAYSSYYLHLGEISSYPPGYKENAGIFCHTNPWIMIAEAMIGRGDIAHGYSSLINPSARESMSDLHRCEPYVYAQMIAGPDAVRYGEAKNSWLTGTAAWNYVAITQWILGIRPTFTGLQIAPVIPRDWHSFKTTRVYRGVIYRITVSRTGPGNSVSLVMDNQPIRGSIVPLPSEGKAEVNVEVTLS